MNKGFLVFIIFMLSAQLGFATGQISDLIIHEGDTLPLLSLPLEDYLQNEEDTNTVRWICSTALWRGYQGLWKLENGELFLMDVFLCDRKEKSILPKFFDIPPPIKANWYSGKLFIQHGKIIRYYHSGFDRYFEEETVVNIEKGQLTNQQHFVNGNRPNDTRFPNNPAAIMAEIYKRINWKALPKKLSKDKKLFVTLNIGAVDSFTIARSNLPEIYTKEIQRVLDGFPELKKFYARGKPIRDGYILPIVFSREKRRKSRKK